MFLYTNEGYQKASQWVEAVTAGKKLEEVGFTVSDMILTYSHLVSLEHKPMSKELRSLRHAINNKLGSYVPLETFQQVWASRHLPYSEPFVKLAIRRLAILNMNLNTVLEDPRFKEEIVTDPEFAADIDITIKILGWVMSDKELERRTIRMVVMLEDRVKQAKQAKALRLVKNGKKGMKRAWPVEPNGGMWKKALGC